MKIFQHITDQEDYLESYKVLGINIMEKATLIYKKSPLSVQANNPIKKVYKRYIGSIVYKTKLYNQCGIYKREIRILSIPVIGIERINGYKFFQVFGINVFKKRQQFLIDFKNGYINNLNIKFDHAYILLRHIGDAYTCLIFIHGIIKKNNSKNPLIIVFSEQLLDLVKMTCSDIPCVFINSKKPFHQRFLTRFSRNYFDLDRKRFFMLINSWTISTIFLQRYKKDNIHLNRLDAWSYILDINYKNTEIERAKVLQDANKNVIQKCEKNQLHINKFVFLAPDTFSYALISSGFWESLIKEFNNKGYDVFINRVAKKAGEKMLYTMNQPGTDLDSIYSYKTFELTLAEAFALASKAKKIVAIRSGFSEILAQCDTNIYILYSASNSEGSRLRLNSLTLSRYPFTNKDKLHEYAMIENSFDYCIKNIVEDVSL